MNRTVRNQDCPLGYKAREPVGKILFLSVHLYRIYYQGTSLFTPPMCPTAFLDGADKKIFRGATKKITNIVHSKQILRGKLGHLSVGCPMMMFFPYLLSPIRPTKGWWGTDNRARDALPAAWGCQWLPAGQMARRMESSLPSPSGTEARKIQ